MTLLWTLFTIGLIILEAATTQLICIWFAGGTFAALIVALFNTDLWIQIVTFVIVSALLLIFTKKLVNSLKSKDPVKTNADALIGQRAAVISPISNEKETGTVKVRGMVWTARSEDGSDIDTDKIVTVKQIEGVKLIVKED